MSKLRRITDGVLFQAVLTGSLSFSHIHDLAQAHGQTGWKAWLYPLSVDLLTVAAYRKLMASRSTRSGVLPWIAFLLGLAASLAANIISAWGNNTDRALAVCLGVWPAVAFLVCTLLSHNETASSAPSEAEPVAAGPVDPTSAVLPAPAPAPAVAVQVVNQIAAPTAAAAIEPTAIAPALLDWARTVADGYEREHGFPIDQSTLRTRLRISDALAASILDHLATAAIGS